MFSILGFSHFSLLSRCFFNVLMYNQINLEIFRARHVLKTNIYRSSKKNSNPSIFLLMKKNDIIYTLPRSVENYRWRFLSKIPLKSVGYVSVNAGLRRRYEWA